jgi:hypothetical protein
MMTVIPTSYFSKDLYTEIWGDPRNLRAADVPATPHIDPRRGESVFNFLTLASTLRQRLVVRPVMTNDCATQSGA